MSDAKTTTNHNEIRKWVEARGGEPARVKRTGRGRDQGILRIDYPGFSGEETLEHISWDDWFDAFDDNQLAFVYQDKVRTGATSRFSKLVAREKRAGNGANGKSATARRGGASKRTTKKTGSSESERTTRKAPRALAARTSKRPTAKKRGSTASSSTKRSSKKRASSSGRSSGTGRSTGTTKRSASKRGGSKKRSAKK